MENQLGHRICRPATDEERERHRLAREQIAAELPEIKKRARAALAALKKEGTPLRHAVAALRVERERQGPSLVDLNERTGIYRAALSRLENNQDANLTISTPQRYASAIGKHMIVLLADSPAG